MLKYSDIIYGEISIREPVLIEIINTPIFQRLKKISQDGAVHFIQPARRGNRFEHSIGVWYLSNKFKRGIEEQIACLLHDLSHTAFSHVIDFVVGDKKQEYADSRLNEIILNSEIPQIVKKYGYSIEKVLDKSKFPLLDCDLPDISFDRIDYFLRDGYSLGFLPKETVNLFLENIFEENHVLYFRDINIAGLYATMYLALSRLIWSDPTSHGSFFLLSSAIKSALNAGEIQESDFFTDDEILLEKLKASKSNLVNNYLNRLRPGLEFEYADKDVAEFWGPSKPRFVDPLVKTNGRLKRVSSQLVSLKYAFKEFSEKYSSLGVVQKI